MVTSFLEWVGLKEPEDKKAKVERVVGAPAPRIKIEESTRPSTPERDVKVELNKPEAEPPAPPTATIREIAHLINVSPDKGTVTLLETFSGTWETTEPISFGGEFGQRERAGLMWRMTLPEEPAKTASTQYTVQGADEWSRWEQVELDIATVKFEGSEHFYPSIRLSPVSDVAFIGEDEIVFAMVTTPGQEPKMVTMRRTTIPETELPNHLSEAEQEVGEILSVFKEGTLDEAKVIVSRLEATATSFPDVTIVPSLRNHILAVFRAENTFLATENKVVVAEKRVAELLEKAKAAVRQNNDGDALGIAQEALRLAKQEEQQLRESVEGSRQVFKEVLVSAEKFCADGGSILNNFETVLHKVRDRFER
ncbi:hypothetical protein VSU19_19900 [Verrucomicrobiales bacterium BCK34]|nr:hypothetical protein [Verrucomicrobiales bacterium BCK34]